MPKFFSRRPKAASTSTSVSSRKIFPSGIKLLHDSENSVIDIIFVHGLTGDRERTWKTKEATATWPQTLLPSKIPNARILTFGYDAYITDFRGMVSKNRIGNHSMNLLSTVATYREDDDTNDRPIIFVCHSLGGLVCANALTAAERRPEPHLKSILRSTRGIAFLGTPHHGSGLANWADALARWIGLFKQTNSEILAVLKGESEVLARIQDEFHTMIRSRQKDGLQPIEITCFYEELPLPGVGMVVPFESAVLPGYIPIEIRGNHMNMTKFEHKDDPGFIAIAGELRRWVKGSIAPSNPEVLREAVLGQPQPVKQQDRTLFIPYTSNPGFVGRSEILDNLKARLNGNLRPKVPDTQARVALFGLGGIGKTQIALTYTYWVQAEFPEVSIFWIHASNAERFHQAYSQIAQSCKIPGYDDPKGNKLSLVKTWLEKKDQRRWLMIIDNADDTEMFFDFAEATPQKLEETDRLASEGNLGHYIPECSHGAILVTTRNKQAGVELTKGRSLIEVGSMNQTESSQLIHERLENNDLDPNQLSRLTDCLENLPLALIQATAFIQENSLTITKYMQLLNQNDNNLINLLSEPFEAEGRDSSVPNAVTATWIVSFEQIRKKSPYASDLLSLMSFFDRQGIPKAFLSYKLKTQEDEDEDDQAIRLIDLEKSLGKLKAFSFISEGKDDETLNMHRLIQLVMRKWLLREGKFKEWAGKALSTVSGLYPDGCHENRKICRDYLPHAHAVLSHKDLSSTTEADAKASLLYHSAKFMVYLGQWKKAEELALQAVEMDKKLLGEGHIDTLTSINTLGEIYRNQGRWNEAEELHKQVLEIRLKVLGPEHPCVLTSMNNLALVYSDQGRWKEAEELYKQVLEIRLKVLGQEHPDVLGNMNNLALVYSEQGRWKKAEELHKKVLEIGSEVLGQEHPDVLTSMDNLAAVYSDQGRWKEAEELQKQVLELGLNVLGQEHPVVLTSMNNLACTWKAQGNKDKAIKLMSQCIRLEEKVLGTEHPNTKTSRWWLKKWEDEQDSHRKTERGLISPLLLVGRQMRYFSQRQ